MPRRGQWPGFRFTITHDAGDDEIGIIKHRAEGMTERITQLATFMNGARRFRGNMTRDAAGKGELLEQLL